MRFKNILITGGAGYVGAVLVPKLIKRGFNVTVVDWYLYEPNVFSHVSGMGKLREVKGDIRNRAMMKNALKGADAVIHLACISNDPSFELNPKLGKSINYDATVQLVDLAKEARVKRFIYASSSSVYGIKKVKQVTEDLPLKPLTDYSKYKALSEKYILNSNDDNFHVLILRPSTVCGYSPRLRLDLTVNLLTIQALVNGRMTVFGGEQLRPNIHIEDMASLYVKTLIYPDKKISGKIFNAGYDNFSVGEIAKMVKRTVKSKKLEIIVTPSNDNRSYHVSSKKIKKELGFVAKKSVEDAIRDIFKAFKKGLIPNALTDARYYNIKMMQKMKIK